MLTGESPCNCHSDLEMRELANETTVYSTQSIQLCPNCTRKGMRKMLDALPSKIYITGLNKSRFTAANTQNSKFILVSLFSNYLLFSIRITLNLLLPRPVFIASDHLQEWRMAGESWDRSHSCVTPITFSESHCSSFKEEVGGSRCFANCPSPSSRT